MHFDFVDFEDPRKQLSLFVNYVRDLLNMLVMESEGSSPLRDPYFNDDFRLDIRAAWVDLEPHFGAVLKDIERVEYERLQDHGLVGAQLRLKLRIVSFFSDKFRKGGKGVLKRLLDVIDDLLDSLSDVVPGAKAIAEFKDALKNCLL